MKINKNSILFLVILGFLILTSFIFKKNPDETIKVKVLDYSNISTSNKYTGIVSPKEIFSIVAEGPTIVEKFLVKVGDEVKKGDHLVVFSNISLLENERILRSNEIDIEDTRLKLSNLESGPLKIELNNKILEIKNLEEELLNKKRTLPILESEAKSAKNRLTAYKTLFKEGGVTSTDLSSITSQFERINLDLINLKSSILLNQDKLAFLKQNYNSLNKELSLEKMILLSKLEKLNLENNILNKRFEQISKPFVSPYDGIVYTINSQDGISLAGGERLLTIATQAKNIVKLDIPIENSQNIKVGDEALVTPPNNETGDASKILGKVSKVSSIAKSSADEKKNLIIETEIEMPDSIHFNPGYFVDVEIFSDLKSNTLSIDSFSIFEDKNQPFVFILDNGVAKKTLIDIGFKTKNSAEVLNLPKGTKIIINPFNIMDGQHVLSE